MGRRATVLSIWTGEIDATGLPEPLGLFLVPKTGNKKKIARYFGSKNSPKGSGRPVASISPVQMLKAVARRPIWTHFWILDLFLTQTNVLLW